MRKIISTLFIILFLLSSCGKYEDGPAISLRSKEKRLSGNWMVDEVLYGIDSTFMKNNKGEFEITKNGDFIASETFKFDSSAITLKHYGTWEWEDNKNGIYIYLPRYYDTLFDYYLDIHKLGNEVLWFENDSAIIFKCTKIIEESETEEK